VVIVRSFRAPWCNGEANAQSASRDRAKLLSAQAEVSFVQEIEELWPTRRASGFDAEYRVER